MAVSISIVTILIYVGTITIKVHPIKWNTNFMNKNDI